MKLKPVLKVSATIICLFFLILLGTANSISNPLLNNRNITAVMNPYISQPVKGEFSVPLWSLTGKSLYCSGKILDIKNDILQFREKLDLGQNIIPFGWNSRSGSIFSIKEEFGATSLLKYNIDTKKQEAIDLQVRKSWRKIRIIDPVLGMDGLIYGILLREAEESNVKDCFLFSMDQNGDSFRQLSENSVINVKSKMFFVGKKVSFGRLRFPASSYDGKFISYLILKDIDPQRYIFDLCVRNEDGSSSRVLLKGLSHPGPPSWSPDGKYIALMAKGENGESEVIVSDLQGNIKARVPTNGRVKNEAYHLDDVSWSFDGEWLSFVRENGNSLGISSRDGKHQFTVTQLKTSDTEEARDIIANPRWSPGGYNLVYEQKNLLNGTNIAFLYLVRFIP